MSADEPKPNAVTDAGVTTETHKLVSDENMTLRQELASLKAKTEIHDARQRDTLATMKPAVEGFISDLVADPAFETYKHELAPMTRWASEMATGDALETNLSIGRLVSCASARFKRTIDEASANSEKGTLLASTMKELEGVKAERDLKISRITELEELVHERTGAATKLQDELARAGLLQEKVDFSNRSARESAPTSNSAGKKPMTRVTDGLADFMLSGPSSGGLKIGQSSTGHGFLGASGGGSDDVAAAIRAAAF